MISILTPKLMTLIAPKMIFKITFKITLRSSAWPPLEGYRNLKLGSPSIGRLFRLLWAAVERWLNLLTVRPALRLLTLGWMLAIIFVSFSVLAGLNPFHLLLPGRAIPFPNWDPRPIFTFYGLAGEPARLVPIKRLYDLSDSIEPRTRQIAYAITTPTGIQEGQSGKEGYLHEGYLHALPLFGNAIRKAWSLEPALLIVDLNRAALENELRLFSRRFSSWEISQEPSQQILRPKEQGGLLLDHFFRVFIASLLEINGDLDSILFLLDGRQGTIASMKMVDLSRRYGRDFLEKELGRR